MITTNSQKHSVLFGQVERSSTKLKRLSLASKSECEPIKQAAN